MQVVTGDNMKIQKYIITKFDIVADVLSKSGYSLLSHKEGIWTFLNDGKHALSAEDKKEMVFSNKLFL